MTYSSECLPHNGDLVSARSHTTKSASAPPAETTRASEGDTETATTEAWCKRWRPTSERVAVSQMITRTFSKRISLLQTRLKKYNHRFAVLYFSEKRLNSKICLNMYELSDIPPLPAYLAANAVSLMMC